MSLRSVKIRCPNADELVEVPFNKVTTNPYLRYELTLKDGIQINIQGWIEVSSDIKVSCTCGQTHTFAEKTRLYKKGREFGEFKEA